MIRTRMFAPILATALLVLAACGPALPKPNSNLNGGMYLVGTTVQEPHFSFILPGGWNVANHLPGFAPNVVALRAVTKPVALAPDGSITSPLPNSSLLLKLVYGPDSSFPVPGMSVRTTPLATLAQAYFSLGVQQTISNVPYQTLTVPFASSQGFEAYLVTTTISTFPSATPGQTVQGLVSTVNADFLTTRGSSFVAGTFTGLPPSQTKVAAALANVINSWKWR